MTSQPHVFALDEPASLIAAIPAVLGFAPEQSLVVVTVDRGDLGAVLRADLAPDLAEGTDHFAQIIARARPDAAIAVIVDENAMDCDTCSEDHRELVERLAESLDDRGIVLLAGHVVDRVTAGGRWRCVDDCGASGVVDDPEASPVAAAAVLDGRRLYRRRDDLLRLVAAVDPTRAERLGQQIGRRAASGRRMTAREAADAVRAAMTMAAGVARGGELADDEIAALAVALTDARVRDTLYALAVGDGAADAEALWTLLARILPDRWRTEALVLVAFSAYARGDGPLAGISLEEALIGDDKHRMAGMLDQALQSGMHPRQIRELALTGYQTAAQIGLRLPRRRAFGERS